MLLGMQESYKKGESESILAPSLADGVAIRLLSGVHVRRAALGLPGPVPMRDHRRGLPVLVHAVSQRAWGLRLRGTTRRLALTSARVWPSPSGNRVGIPI